MNSPDNDTWPRALDITAATAPARRPSARRSTSRASARWFKVHVAPGGSVTLDLSGLPADYDVYLFRDIAQTYDSPDDRAGPHQAERRVRGLRVLGLRVQRLGFSRLRLQRLGVLRAPGFSGSGFSGLRVQPRLVQRLRLLRLRASPAPASPAPGSAAPGSPGPGSAAPGSPAPASRAPGFSADSFSAAQVYSLIAWSNNLGTADEHAASNTWTSTGDFYIRVNGKNGVLRPGSSPFTLNVTVDGSLCAAGADPSGTKPAPDRQHQRHRHPHRHVALRPADTTAMVAKLGQLATATNGVVVDLARDARGPRPPGPGRRQPGLRLRQEPGRARRPRTSSTPTAAATPASGVKYVVLAGGDNVAAVLPLPGHLLDRAGGQLLPAGPGRPPPPRPASAATTCWARTPTASSKFHPARARRLPDPGPPGRAARGDPGRDRRHGPGLPRPARRSARRTSLVTGYDFIADAATADQDEPRRRHRPGRPAALIDPYGALAGRPAGPRPHLKPSCSGRATTSRSWAATSAPTARSRPTSRRS